MLEPIALSIVGIIVLIFGGDFLVRGASNLAYKLMISPLVVGLTVVAFGTSAPELFISTWSALSGHSNLAIGNVIGSNICNLSLVLGITAMFYPILIKQSSVKIDWGLTIGSGLLLFFFISLDNHLGRMEGIIMLLILVIYTYALIQSSRKKNQQLAAEGKEVEHDEDVPGVEEIVVWKEVLFFLVGIFGLWLGVKLFGESVVDIADQLGMNKAIAGLTVVAIATSLPELITSVIAAYKKNTDLAIGNLLGSCIFNVLSILGVTGIITDIDGIQARILDFDMIWMFAGMLLLIPMIFVYKKFNFLSGLVLLLFYIAYTTVLVLKEMHVDIFGMSL